ncbi:MAG: hypothetical protein ACOZAL_02685, partial [Patescibacteria group bacterium]
KKMSREIFEPDCLEDLNEDEMHQLLAKKKRRGREKRIEQLLEAQMEEEIIQAKEREEMKNE